jgi:hypothetical protein
MIHRTDAFPGKQITVLILVSFILRICSNLTTEQESEGVIPTIKSPSIENLNPIGLLTLSASDSRIYNDYIVSIESIYDTFHYFNISKYGGRWQYEVARDWTSHKEETNSGREEE